MPTLTGMTALITGGSSGIVPAIATPVAAKGACALIYRRLRGMLQIAIRQIGSRALAFAAALPTQRFITRRRLKSPNASAVIEGTAP